MRRLCLLLVLPVYCSLAGAITVGSKNFTESYLLAEIVAQTLEAEGYAVDRKFGLGGTLVCYEALINGEIGVYVEYTGTLEQAILRGTDLHPSVADLNRRLVEPVRILDSLGFNNTYAMTMKASLADERDIKTVSDLRAHPDLSVSFSLEFLNRKDGWPGLQQLYDLPHQPAGIDHGLAYQAINNGSVDLTDAYSTDGDLQRYALTILKDDQGYFPDYYAVPFVREDMDAAAIAAVEQLAGRLDDDRMRSLNAEVVINERSFAEVASSFLAAQGLTESDAVESSLTSSILRNTLVHLKLTSIALLLGCLVGLPLGIVTYRRQQLARVIVYLAGLMQTIPSIALLALMMPLFGIGELPAVIALFLYSILPILRNTITSLITIDPVLKRAADSRTEETGMS